MSARGEETPSKVEIAKAGSRHLRGAIEQTLADGEADHFGDDDIQILKFHGVYQQDDRDARIERRKAGLGKAYSFMLRIAVPGGRCDAEQYLAVDRLADEYANGTLRLTTRQAFQLHGILKGDLHATLNGINRALLTSLSACGDVPRNVMASPAPFADDIHRTVQRLAIALSQDLKPATGAYHQIWVDGERVYSSDDEKETEPFYGETYLPRKFKLGVAIDTDNSIDLYAYDAGFVAVTNGSERIEAYNLLVGGGLGMTHNKPDTFARMATVIASIPAEDDKALETMRAVVAVFRDNGDRADRRHARLKYLVERWGVDRFRDELQRRLSFALAPARETAAPRQLDHLGRFEQGDGRQFLGVWVENGRIADVEGVRTRSAFRHIVEKHAPTVVLTPMQSILLADLEPHQADDCIDVLRAHGVALVDELSSVRRYAMACPALPTCGLALAESERVQPGLIGEFEEAFETLGIADAPLTVRMTGCPNGCARPYNADIGIVGRKPGVYHVFVGGGLGGDRLADLFASDVPFEEIVSTLRPLLERFRDERGPDEGLGDYYRRAIATDRPERNLLTGRETPSSEIYEVRVVR